MNYQFWIVFQFLKYNLQSTDEHSIHGPFLFEFYTKAIKPKRGEKSFGLPSFWEKERAILKDNKTQLTIQDFGAGSRVSKSNKRSISEIASSSLSKSSNLLRMLRIIDYSQPKVIVELGTNLGLTAIVLAKVFPDLKIFSVEGDPSLFNYALTLKNKYHCHNLTLINDSFENALQKIGTDGIKTDFMFLDGDHSSKGTLKYVNWFIKNSTEKALLILDDIRWSKDMMITWTQIVKFEDFQVGIDLFNQGILIKNPNLKKQNFMLKY